MESKTEKAVLLAQYKDYFSDEYLFEIANLELVEEDRIPQIITGDQAEGRILNGHYSVELIGENPGCKRLESLRVKEERQRKSAEAKEAAAKAAEEIRAAGKAKKSKGDAENA